MLKKAYKKGWITNIPHIEKISNDNSRVRWLTFREAQNLISALPSHLADMVQYQLLYQLSYSGVKNV